MNKAFIFDLDGVLIDDEKIWETKKQKMYHELFGEQITEKMGSTLGVNMDGIYKLAEKAGAHIDKQSFIKAFHELAEDIYHTALVPEGLDKLAATLKELGYKIGIVSASPL